MKANGLSRAGENFANGYFANNPNGAAENGLEVALGSNAIDTSTVIDFDNGSGDYNPGTYQEDGFSLEWYAPAPNNNGDLFDIDSDGDNEFGAQSGAENQAVGILSRDDGESFSLAGLEIVGDDGGDPSDFVYIWYEDAEYITFSYNYNDGVDQWQTWVWDKEAGSYQTASALDTSETVFDYYTDIDELKIQVYTHGDGGLGIDNIEIM